jgi:thioredoxin-disulfide reductase
VVEIIYETIIIGAGIAGATAAIYASRKRMRFELISPDAGGQMMASGDILNYPGIVKTTGVEFSDAIEKQLQFNGVKLKKESVRAVKKKGKNFIVTTDKGEYETKTLIIATGARSRKLNVPGEEKFARKGVAYCSICDGPLFSGKRVAVVGGGNAALEAADFMKEIASKIYVIVIGEKFIGHAYLMEKIKSNPKVETIFEAETLEITGDKLVKGLKYRRKGNIKDILVDGVIIEIGRVPNTDLFKDVVKTEPDGHIAIDCQMNTSVPGIFAAGDCASGHEYQYVIAAGQGCMALLKAARYIANQKQ